MLIWKKEFWQRNGDYPGVVDSCWWYIGSTPNGNFLCWVNSQSSRHNGVVSVEGDVVAAQAKLPETDEDWPSYFLGCEPDDECGWDYVCETLGLTRVAEPKQLGPQELSDFQKTNSVC